MADWKVYAKAARNTARRQAPELADQARRSARGSASRAGGYARAAGRAAEQSTRDSRKNLRRDAAAYAVVTGRTMKRAQIGRRLLHALRDAVLMGVSLLVIWFVVTRTGVQIPITAVLAVVLVLMVVRFGYALVGRPDTAEDDDEDLDATQREAFEQSRDRDREFDPRETDRERERRDR